MTLANVVWDAPALRGLDDRARGDLALVANRRTLEGGAELFRAGDAADHVFVVEEGTVLVKDGTGRLLRRVMQGEGLGEEALVFTFGARLASAVADGRAVVVGLPAALLRRVWLRAGSGGHAAKITRALTRQAMRDTLTVTVPSLRSEEVELLLDASRLLEVSRGDVILRGDERRPSLYIVAGGLVQFETEGDGPKGYASAQDVFTTGARAVAARPTWLLRLEDAALAPKALVDVAERGARYRADGGARVEDLGRLVEGRSLLLLDGDACVRCGHCASACADAHVDGLSRILRAGPIVSLAVMPQAILASSCEHCRTPACLPACPTGAIHRSEDGRVDLRAELCTGCGSCAKACPWDNLALAPRPGGSGAEPGTSADVAIKCDLCAGTGHGPACVSACPTGALIRIDGPTSLTAAPMERDERPVLKAAAVTALVALALVFLGGAVRAARVPLGVAAALGLAVLMAYGVLKRRVGVRRLLRLPVAATGQGTARDRYLAHVAIGVATFAAALGHAQGSSRSTTLARATLFALFAATASGAFGALVYRALPPRLSRLAGREWLPETGAAEAKRLGERTFAELSGRTELVKTLFARVLDPYRRSPFVLLRLLTTNATLAREVETLEGRIEGLLEGRGKDKREGLDRLVRAVAEEACFRAARVALFALTAWPAVHVVAAIVVALVCIAHGVTEGLAR